MVGALVLLLAHTVTRGSELQVLIPIPILLILFFQVTQCLDALRALFSCCNCVVVAASLPSSCPSLPSLTSLLSSLVSSVTTHAPHHLPALCTGFPLHHTDPEHARVASLAVLTAAVECRAAGDPALLSSLVSSLLASAGDPSPLARRLALQGVAGLASCGQTDREAAAGQCVAALLEGLGDEQCSAVSLTALQGLVALLPALPSH